LNQPRCSSPYRQQLRYTPSTLQSLITSYPNGSRSQTLVLDWTISASGWSLWPFEARDDTQRTPLDIAMMLSRSNSTMSSSTNTSTTAGPGAGPSRPRKRADHIPSLTLPELSPVPLNDLEAVDKMLMRCDEAELEGVVDRERRRWEAIPEELFARPVSSGPASPSSEYGSALQLPVSEATRSTDCHFVHFHLFVTERNRIRSTASFLHLANASLLRSQRSCPKPSYRPYPCSLPHQRRPQYRAPNRRRLEVDSKTQASPQYRPGDAPLDHGGR
jgi:hypothetical protein